MSAPPAAPEVNVTSKYVSEFAIVSRDVVIGHGCVIHPGCRIEAKYGKIEIGEYCVFEEMCEIMNVNDKASDGVTTPTLVIGANNLFRVGCKVHARAVGSHNVFDIKSRLMQGCVVGDGCTVRTAAVVNPYTSLPNHSVVFGPANEIRTVSDKQMAVNKRSTYTLSHHYRLLVSQKASAPPKAVAPPPPATT